VRALAGLQDPTMLRSLSKEVRDCHAHGEDCARKAEIAFTDEHRDDLLRLQQSRLTLARSYEFAETAYRLLETQRTPPRRVLRLGSEEI
jgi:hypothetical protein